MQILFSTFYETVRVLLKASCFSLKLYARPTLFLGFIFVLRRSKVDRDVANNRSMFRRRFLYIPGFESFQEFVGNLSDRHQLRLTEGNHTAPVKGEPAQSVLPRKASVVLVKRRVDVSSAILIGNCQNEIASCQLTTCFIPEDHHIPPTVEVHQTEPTRVVSVQPCYMLHTLRADRNTY